ncbi:MAG: DUF881 domain-containing protein [Actinobacteria bacterium]|nr:DUF881 domain-containing protein [Actinomycetota bacterium]
MSEEEQATGASEVTAAPGVRGTRRWLMLTRAPSRWSLLVPVVGVLAGVLFTSSSQASRGTDLRSEVQGLPQLIMARQHANADRGRQLAAVQAEIDRLSEAAAPGSSRLKTLGERADALAPVAGTVPVHGETLTVALNDSPMPVDQLPEWATVDDIVVHQQDVQAVVNALWRGGAEAMTIMDQRVIATSAVRCVGNTLILQGRVYSPPFIISAIGDPDALEAALAADPTITRYQEYVAALGLGYAVERTGVKTFPAFTGPLARTAAKAASD